MRKPLYVPEERWLQAIKYLRGLGANSSLINADRRKLDRCAVAQDDEDASRILREVMGWEKARATLTKAQALIQINELRAKIAADPDQQAWHQNVLTHLALAASAITNRNPGGT